MRGQQRQQRRRRRRRRRRQRGNFISRRDARRPSQRNYLLRSAARRRLARVLHGRARPPANPSRPARCAPGRTALSDGRSAGERATRFRPIRRRIVKSRLHLPCCRLATPAATYVPPIDTHPSLSRGVPPNLASFYRAVSKASQ